MPLENSKDNKDLAIISMSSKSSGFDQYIPGNNFKVWEKRFRQFLLREKIAEGDKTMWLITVISSEPCEVLMNLTSPKEAETVAFEEIMQILGNHYGPKTNKRSERFKFYKALQDNGETISDYIVRIRMLSQTCEFGTFLDEALSDKLITGLRNEKIQQALLNKETKVNENSFEKYCELALNMELAEQSARCMKSSTMSVVGAIHQKKFNSQKTPRGRVRQQNTETPTKNVKVVAVVVAQVRVIEIIVSSVVLVAAQVVGAKEVAGGAEEIIWKTLAQPNFGLVFNAGWKGTRAECVNKKIIN